MVSVVVFEDAGGELTIGHTGGFKSFFQFFKPSGQLISGIGLVGAKINLNQGGVETNKALQFPNTR